MIGAIARRPFRELKIVNTLCLEVVRLQETVVELCKEVDVLFVLGGPRIDHALARELGFDAGFGPGTRPEQVASYIVDRLLARQAGVEGTGREGGVP